MTSSEPPPAGTLALGGAVVGAALAVVILFVAGVPVVSFPVVVVGLLAVAAATAVALLLAGPAPVDEPAGSRDPGPPREGVAVSRSDPFPPTRRPPPPPPAGSHPPAQALPAPPPPQPPRTPPPARHVLHPLSAGDGTGSNGGGDWWNRRSGQAGAPVEVVEHAAVAPRAAPALDSYLTDAVVAQCPNCGEFRVVPQRTDDGYAFDCPSCREHWTWRPGEAWPGIDVAPRRRRPHRSAES